MGQKNKRCLILGGSSEIGIELSKLLLKNSIVSYPTYSSNSGLNRIKQALGQSVIPVFLDLSLLDSVYDFFNKQLEFEYLVDLAHTNLEGLVASLSDKDIISYYNVNVVNRTIFLKYLTRNMLIKRKGRLIYVSSTAAKYPNKGQGLYGSAKLAIEAIYKTIGIEMYKKSISTMIIRPGYILSGRARDFIKDKMDLLGKFVIEPIDLANAILFFLKDEGRCFNATEIILDRGFFSSKRWS